MRREKTTGIYNQAGKGYFVIKLEPQRPIIIREPSSKFDSDRLRC